MDSNSTVDSQMWNFHYLLKGERRLIDKGTHWTMKAINPPPPHHLVKI